MREVRMKTSFHVPVMLDECIEALQIDPEGTYVDLTFGGGGHSTAILEKLNDQGRLFAFDRDEDALKNALTDSRFQLIHQNFRYAPHFLDYYNALPVDGILADFGVSSHQFNTAERGFSTRFEGDLDMRMSSSMETSAADLITNEEPEKLIRIFREYGELKNAVRIVKLLKETVKNKRISSTSDLIDTLSPLAPKGKENKFFAKVFQALRIEINQELESIEHFLEKSPQMIKKNGRMVIMTYHSLEDRLVKNFIRSGNLSGNQEKDFYGNLVKPFSAVNNKPITAGDEELETNPRSRSAKLRVAQRN